MKAEILKMLRETGDYVSGQEICEKFGVSRTAVWKVIRQLQEEGYQVEAVRSKGYRILDEPDVITAEEVASLMETEWAGKPVVYYPETDSTNIQTEKVMTQAEAEQEMIINNVYNEYKRIEDNIELYMTALENYEFEEEDYY